MKRCRLLRAPLAYRSMTNIRESRQAFAFEFKALSVLQFRTRILCARSGVFLAVRGGLMLLCLSMGCTTLNTRPELRPEAWAPPSATREWDQSRMTARQYELDSIPA